MKILVIYSSVWGVSKRCSEMLCERLENSFEITLCDIKDGAPSPEGFDVAVIGGSIRMSKLNKRLKAYLKEHADVLCKIQTALFICCGFTDSFEDYAHFQFPRTVIPSLGIHYFGGELKPDKLKGIDKLIVKSVRSSVAQVDIDCPNDDRPPLPEIIPENIWRLADRIRALM